MQELTLEHELHCDEDTYWYSCVFNPKYNAQLYLEILKFPRYEFQDIDDDGRCIRYSVIAQPALPPLPDIVKAVIEDGLVYKEEGIFDRQKRRYLFRGIAVVGKAVTSGELILTSIGLNRTLRTAKLKVEVDIPLVGGLLEDLIVQSLRESHDKAVEFTNRYIQT